MRLGSDCPIGGTVHYSIRPSETRKAPLAPRDLTPCQKAVVDLIPYYPQSICRHELYSQCSMPKRNIESIISTLPSFVLLAEDKNGLTRLKEDLSNVF